MEHCRYLRRKQKQEEGNLLMPKTPQLFNGSVCLQSTLFGKYKIPSKDKNIQLRMFATIPFVILLQFFM
jgi:hypothetical protein